jgi:F-type H+-transporting ATPase subunit delta
MKKAKITDYAKALHEATKGLEGEKLDRAIANFIIILMKEGKLSKVEKIIEKYLNFEKRDRGVKQVEVTTSFGLSETAEKMVKDHFGGEVEITKKKDEKIIGGFKIKLDDTVIDASVKTQLVKMKESLT